MTNQPKRERDDLLHELQVLTATYCQIQEHMRHDTTKYGEWQANYGALSSNTMLDINDVREQLGWKRIAL